MCEWKKIPILSTPSPFSARENLIPIIGQFLTGRSWILSQCKHIRHFFLPSFLLFSLLLLFINSSLLPFFSYLHSLFLIYPVEISLWKGSCAFSDCLPFLPEQLLDVVYLVYLCKKRQGGFIYLGFPSFTGLGTPPEPQIHAPSTSTLCGQTLGKGHTD